MKKEYLHIYIRRGVLALMILVAAILQNTAHMLPTIFGARAFLLIPVVVCISMFEKDVSSTIFGAFAGVLWDVSSCSSTGFNTIMMMIIATSCGFLIHYLMRNNMVTATLLTSVALIFYSLVYWLMFSVSDNASDNAFKLLTFFLPSCVYSLALMPPTYVIIRSFLKKLRGKLPVQRRLRKNN